MSYLGNIQQLITDRAPYWIGNGPGGVFLQACGLLFDSAHATLLSGLRQTRPGTAFVDALSYLAADRGIKRYPAEPVASWRARLQRWRQIKRHAGSHYGEMISLAPYFLPGSIPRIRIVHQDGAGLSATWHTLDPDGTYSVHRATPSNWSYDSSTFEWSRFWVIIEATPEMGTAAHYDDGTVYDNGVTVYDGYLSTAQAADIVSIVLDSKAAHSALWGVIVVPPGYLSPTGTTAVLADGSSSYPAGNWYLEADPGTGKPTVPEYVTFLYKAG